MHFTSATSLARTLRGTQLYMRAIFIRIANKRKSRCAPVDVSVRGTHGNKGARDDVLPRTEIVYLPRVGQQLDVYDRYTREYNKLIREKILLQIIG